MKPSDAMRTRGSGKSKLVSKIDFSVCLIGAWAVSTDRFCHWRVCDFSENDGIVYSGFNTSEFGRVVKQKILEFNSDLKNYSVNDPASIAVRFNDNPDTIDEDVISILEKAEAECGWYE